MYAHEKAALERISASLKERYPNTVVSLFAFGSRTRGDHAAGSDFDVLVVVRERSPEVEDGIVDTFVEEEMKSGLFFDPVIKTMRSYELEKRHHAPFFENIEREGILF